MVRPIVIHSSPDAIRYFISSDRGISGFLDGRILENFAVAIQQRVCHQLARVDLLNVGIDSQVGAPAYRSL